MATVANLRIGIEAVTGGLDAGLKKAQKSIGSFASAMTSAKGLAVGLVGALAVGKIVEGIGSIVAAGSDLSETISKTEVVFGDAAGSVIADAEAMAAAMGTPKTEYLGAASAIGLIGKASGQTDAAAAAMSITMARLAGDASSFYNVPLEDALGAIKSGLVGEAEPMRRFGVLLSESALQAEAARLGIASMTGTLTEAQKVQARASLITKGLADAQGDLARTADSPANKIRELNGRIENLKADLGVGFSAITRSVLGGLATGFEAIAGKIAGSREAIQEWAAGAVAAGGFVNSAILGLGAGIGMAADAVHYLHAGFLAMRGGVTGAIGGIVHGLALAGDAIEALINLLPGVEVEFGSTLHAMAGDLMDLSRGQVVEAFAKFGEAPPSEGIKAFFAEMADGAEKAGAAVAATGGAVNELSTAQLQLAGDVDKLTASLRAEVETFGMGRGEAELYRLAKAGATEAQLEDATAMTAKLSALEKEADARKELEAAAKSTMEATRTPLEKFDAQVGDLKAQLAAGLIDEETFGRAVAKAKGELGEKGEGRSENAALQLGSAEARSAVLRARTGGGDTMKDVAKTGRESLAVQKEQTGLLRVLAGGQPQVYAF